MNCVFVSILEAAFQAQSIGDFKVLPEVTKILQNLPKLEKIQGEQTAEAPSMKCWDVVCAVPSCFKPGQYQRGAKVTQQC